MLESKKDQKVYTRKKFSYALYMYNCSSINFPILRKEKLPFTYTQMKTAAWKNDPVEKLCNQHVKSMAWDKEKSESPEGIPYTGMML